MILLNIAIAIIIPYVLGFGLLKLFFDRPYLNKPLRTGLSYGLGAGVLSQWLLLLSTLQIPYSYSIIAWPLILIGILSLFWVWKSKRNMEKPSIRFDKELDYRIIVPALFVLYITGTIFWEALNWPIYLWDALNLHAYKAKVFFFSNGLTCLPNVPYPGYPLHISFQLFWTALNLGAWDDLLLKIIFPVNYVMFLLVTFGFIKLFAGRLWAWLACALLCSSGIFTKHAVNAYSDFMLMSYHCTVIMLLLIWNHKKDDRILILASLFAGFTSFTKLEGGAFSVFYGMIILFVLLGEKDLNLTGKAKKLVKFCIPAGLIFGHYTLYKVIHFPQPDGKMMLEASFQWPQWEQVTLLSQKILENLFLTNNWCVLWFVLFILIIVRLRVLTNYTYARETTILLLAVLCSFLFYTAALLFTDRNFFVANDSVLSRVFLSFFPLIVVLIVLIGSSSSKHNKMLKSEWAFFVGHWTLSLTIVMGVVYSMIGSALFKLPGTLFSRPMMNIHLIESDSNLNIYALLYFSFLLSICLAKLARKYLLSRAPSLANVEEDKLVISHVWILLIIAVIMFWGTHFQYFRNYINKNVPLEQFYERAYGRRYSFIRNVENMIPDNASIALNFQSKIEDDPRKFEKIMFNYFLYPKVDIRHVCSNKQPYDYVIITDKRPSDDPSLRDYNRIYNEKNLRLFRRKSEK